MYPNVTSIPGQTGVGPVSPAKTRETEGAPGEFDKVFEDVRLRTSEPDLAQSRAPLKFSAHATQRLQDRGITLDAGTMSRVNDAIDKAAAKGVQDTLVLT